MQKIILILIIIAASLLRLINLNLIPPGFSEDEAAISYNAYSILKTGRDEEAHLLPLEFVSFGDYKSPLPVYITVPFVSGGLNINAARLPAALFGILSVYVIFLLGNSLFKDKHLKGVGLIAALLLTFSPLHIQLSRFDTSRSLGIFILLLSLLLFVANLKRKVWWLLFLQILLILSLPSGILVSLSLFFTYFFYSDEKHKKIKGLIVFLFLVMVVLLQKNSINHYFLNDAFFKDISFQNRINELRGYSDLKMPKFVGVVLQNKVVYFVDQVVDNYLKVFDFYYIFSYNWSKEKYFVNEMSKLYPIELIFFFIGLYYISIKKIKELRYLILVIVLSPLISVFKLKQDLITPLGFILVPFYVFAGSGFLIALKYIKKNYLKYLFVVIIGTVYILSLVVFIHYYFYHFPKTGKELSTTSYKDISRSAYKNSEGFTSVVISDKYSRTPYIYYLFYNSIDPGVYQASSKQRSGSLFVSTTKIGNVEFRSINKLDSQLMNVGLIADIEDFSKFENNCLESKNKCKQLRKEVYYDDSGLKVIEFGNLINE